MPSDLPVGFLRANRRERKPRRRGLTEIRGPRCTPMGVRHLVVRLEALRQGLWGTKGLWGRVVTSRP